MERSLTDQLTTPPVETPANGSGGITVNQADNKDLQYAVGELFDDNNLQMKTELSLTQINALTRGHIFADTFKSPLMTKLCSTYETLMVSYKRQGRQEITEITKNIRNNGEQETKKGGILSSLMGL